MSDPKTISIVGHAAPPELRVPEASAALIVAWCEGEPRRVGEVALFVERAPAATLGRGEGEGEPRVRFFRQRPGRLAPTPPLAGLSLSRKQLTVRSSGAKLEIHRVGRCALHVNGLPVDAASVTPGDTVLLPGRLLLYCASRARSIPRATHFDDANVGVFGEPDALGILGEAPEAWRLREAIAFAAHAGKHVLLHGESGTGKELAARAIHRLSTRAGGPFLSRNAATLPAGLIDAELFGNAKNYPNPGMTARQGLIGEADGGTLFLDEIAEIAHEEQAHLLRVLDADGEYQRLGDAMVRRSNFVLVGATNRDLGALKHDMAARFAIRLEVPTLDARREDIPLLIRQLLLAAVKKSPRIAERFVDASPDGRLEPRVDPELVAWLMTRGYETHVRELDTLLWRAMAGSPHRDIMLTDELRTESSGRAGEPTADEIRAALAGSRSNVQAAARALGVKSRYALYRLMKKHGITTGAGADPDEGE